MSLLACLFPALFFTSCRQSPEPVCVIIDTDIGSSTDDLVAIKMLYDYIEDGKAEVLAMMMDRPGELRMEYLQKFNAYYGHGDIPVGTVNEFPGPEPYMFIPYAEEGVMPPCFEDIQVTPYAELPDAVDLYRSTLENAKDNSVDIISLGFLTNLGHLVDRYPELVAKKVRNLYVMGCSSSDKLFHSYNIYIDTPAAQSVLRNWPGKIFVSPGEEGRKIDYLKEDIFEDYKEGGPLRWIYETIETDTGQKMWDCLSVIEAVEGQTLVHSSTSPAAANHSSTSPAPASHRSTSTTTPSLFHYSAPGHYLIDNEGYTVFEEMPQGNTVYHTIDQTAADELYKIIRSHGDMYR